MRINLEKVILRNMIEYDLSRVLEIEELSFSNPWSRMAFIGEICSSPISNPLVIEEKKSKKIIGYIIYWRIMQEAHINNIALHPEFRRKGIGESVLKFILNKIKKEGARMVTLEVRPSNKAAISLYQKLGFRTLGKRKDYYFSPKEDALVFAKYLD
ncbi:MAG: ribosomal protein S18-alanine N-acetyltransferase [Candidatus Aminicenantia bacterium]